MKIPMESRIDVRSAWLCLQAYSRKGIYFKTRSEFLNTIIEDYASLLRERLALEEPESEAAALADLQAFTQKGTAFHGRKSLMQDLNEAEVEEGSLAAAQEALRKKLKGEEEA
jgi:hypothetical protein